MKQIKKQIQNFRSCINPPYHKKDIPFFVTLFMLMLGLVFSLMLVNQEQDTRQFAQAATLQYYISPTGNDLNNGTTQLTPFKTIQKALDVVQPGAVINLAEGIYREKLTTKLNGTADAPIIIKGLDIATDPTLRRKTVLYGTSRIVNVDHSYYQFEGFTVDGQEALASQTYPTDPTQVIAFKDANQSLIKDGRLIYVGSADSTANLTGIKINNMYLRGGGGECVRIRNAAYNNEVTNSVIEYCGMFAKPNADRFSYHNAEAVYIGTSPKSTTQPMYANDTSNNNAVTNNIINLYGSECFNVKENAYSNSFVSNECRYNLEPAASLGSNIELRGHNNIVTDNLVHWSEGYNLKLKSDSSTYDKGGNTIKRNNFQRSVEYSIRDEQQGVQYCGNIVDNTAMFGTALAEVTAVCTDNILSPTAIQTTATPTSGAIATPTSAPVSSSIYEDFLSRGKKLHLVQSSH